MPRIIIHPAMHTPARPERRPDWNTGDNPSEVSFITTWLAPRRNETRMRKAAPWASMRDLVMGRINRPFDRPVKT